MANSHCKKQKGVFNTMGKFAIECPKCGSLNTASTGLFAKKRIPCVTCGNEIDTKHGRFISKICPNCESTFVFDQAKAKDRRCPACGEAVNGAAMATVSYRFAAINCPQCSCNIEVDKELATSECPICGNVIDVKAEIAKQSIVKDTGVSVIKYEGDNQTFIWKHPIEDFNYGSQLIVHESQEAIFFVNGQALDLFGPGRHELETSNIPLLKKQLAGITGGETPFHAEVYFINKTVQMGCRWGTRNRVNYPDPETGLNLSIGASGEFNVQVKDSRKLLVKLIGTANGLRREQFEDTPEAEASRFESLMDMFDAMLQNALKMQLSNAIKAQKISIFDIDSHIGEISDMLKAHVSAAFEEFGLFVPQFYITNFALPENDKDFQKWKELHAQGRIAEKQAAEMGKGDRAKIIASAENAKLEQEYGIEIDRLANERARMAAELEAQKKKLEGFAEAEIMHAKGYSHKDEIEAEIQKAYAAGMGQFGSNMGSGSGGGGGVANEMVGMMMGAKIADNMMKRFENATGDGTAFDMGNAAPNAAAAPTAAGWKCSCGHTNTGKFCAECGKAKPETWDCACGNKGNTGKFCSECGKAKPEPWDCACGHKGNIGKFCAECGQPKAEAWDCECGHKGNTGKFCADCGARRPE